MGRGLGRGRGGRGLGGRGGAWGVREEFGEEVGEGKGREGLGRGRGD